MKKQETDKNNVTVQDIAEIVNISASTVSRALNNHPKISQKTKEKVWDVARKLGYQPNIPVYLNQEQSKAICLMIPEINNCYYISIIESVKEYALKKNYQLYIADTNKSVSTEKAYVQSLINLKIEGVIAVFFDTHQEIDHLNSLLNYNIPTVFLNKNKHDINATSILPDIFQGAYKATKHLLAAKCKKIHVFIENKYNPLYADLIDGYQTAIEESSKGNYKQFIHTVVNYEEIEQQLDDLLQRNLLPDGIISGNDKFNAYIISWYEKNNMKIPDDVLLVGFETGTEQSCYFHPISSIQFSGYKIGQKAVEKLFKQIENKKIKKETIIIPAKFIIRGSSMRF